MIHELYGLIITLENSFATFYGRIKNLARLKEGKAILEVMEMHSYAHAITIEERKKQTKRPKISHMNIIKFQEELNNAVFDQVLKEKDLKIILEKLANAEESLGMLYKSIFNHLMKLSDFYKELAGEIDTISNDEYNHRNMLLNDAKRLK